MNLVSSYCTSMCTQTNITDMNKLLDHVLRELAYEGRCGSNLDTMKEFIKQACEKCCNQFFNIAYSQQFFCYFFKTTILSLTSDMVQYHCQDETNLHSLSELSNDIKELESFCNKSLVSFVINQNTRHRLLLGADKINCNWNPITLQILEMIIQSRYSGITTQSISKRLNLDFKSSFHHCKRLIHMNLTVKMSLGIKNDSHIKHFYVDFAPENSQICPQNQTSKLRLRHEILKILKNAPEQIVLKTDIPELLNIKSDTQKYQLRIAIQSLSYQGCIEQVIARQNDRHVHCYRYINSLIDNEMDSEDDDTVHDNLIQMHIPISLQIIKSVEESGSNGLKSTQIIKSFNLNRKFTESLLEDLSIFPSVNNRKSRFPMKRQVRYIGKERSLFFYSNKQSLNFINKQIHDRRESHTKMERSNILLNFINQNEGIIEMNSDNVMRVQILIDESETKYSKEHHIIDKKTIIRIAQYLESMKKLRVIQLSTPNLVHTIDNRFLDVKGSMLKEDDELNDQKTLLVSEPTLLSCKSNEEVISHELVQRYISNRQNTRKEIPIIDHNVQSLVIRDNSVNDMKLEPNQSWEFRKKYGFITAKMSRIRIIHLFLVRLVSLNNNNIIELTLDTLQNVTIREYFECFGQNHQSDILDSFLFENISSQDTKLCDLPEGLKIQIFHKNNTRYAFKMRFIRYLSNMAKLGLINKVNVNTIEVLSKANHDGLLYNFLSGYDVSVFDDPSLFWTLLEDKIATLSGLFTIDQEKDDDENLETLIQYKFQWSLNSQAPFYYHYQWMTTCIEWISSNEKLFSIGSFESVLLPCLINISETYQVALYKVMEFWQWNQEMLKKQCTNCGPKGGKRTMLGMNNETLRYTVLWCFLRYTHSTHYITDILFKFELERQGTSDPTILRTIHDIIPKVNVIADPLFSELFMSMNDAIFGNSKTKEVRKYRLKNADKEFVVQHVLERLTGEFYMMQDDFYDSNENKLENNRISNRVMKTMIQLLYNENNTNARSRLFGTTITEALSLATSTGSSIKRGMIMYDKDSRATIYNKWSKYHYLDCSMNWDPKEDIEFAVLCLKRMLWIDYKRNGSNVKYASQEWEKLFSQDIWNEAIAYLRRVNAIKYCEKYENFSFHGRHLVFSDKFIQDLGALKEKCYIPTSIMRETSIPKRSMYNILYGLVHGNLELDDNFAISPIESFDTRSTEKKVINELDDSLVSYVSKILDRTRTIWDLKEQVIVNYKDSTNIDKMLHDAIHILQERKEIERISAFHYRRSSKHANYFRLWSDYSVDNNDLELCLCSVEYFIQTHPGCSWSELYTRKRTLFTSLELIELIQILILKGSIVEKHFKLLPDGQLLSSSCDTINAMIMTCYWSS